MKEPGFDEDGWCLEDGEERHRRSPETFWIPDKEDREQLQKGDLAKLIFRIRVEDDQEPEAFERMWVIVRDRIPGGYIGVLDNDPLSISRNDSLEIGTELSFRPSHVIDILAIVEETTEEQSSLH